MLPEISLHLLDAARNAVSAGANHLEIRIVSEPDSDRLAITIRDNGRGMTPQEQRLALTPGYTTRSSGNGGRGLPLFREAAERSGGSFRLESAPGDGTKITAEFVRSQSAPLGELGKTAMAIAAGGIHFTLELQTGEIQKRIDTAAICAGLHAPLQSPAVLRAIAELI